MMRLMLAATAAVGLLAANAFAETNDWVERSNANAQVVLQVLAEFNPESAGSLGVDGTR